MTALYHPRPNRWPQVSLRGLLTVVTLAALLTPLAIGRGSRSIREVELKPGEVRQLVTELEAEVNNGGFDQFFFNSAGDQTARTIGALEFIGAKHTAAIVRAAAAKFPGGMPPADRES